MAADTRPYKSKEQDGQGNEVIIRDQQLVEQSTVTTMPSGACFETLDIDGRPVKIPRDNMMSIVLECIGIVLNDSSKNLGTNVNKALGLQGNTIGNVTVNDFASVLGGTYTDLACYASSPIDLNTITNPGLYRLYTQGGGNTYTNGPKGRLWGLMRVSTTDNYLSQEIYAATDGGGEVGKYGRFCDSSVWNNWSRIDNFGCATPSALATLLGGELNINVNGSQYIEEIATSTNTRFIVWETWLTGSKNTHKYRIAFASYFYSTTAPTIFVQRMDGGTWSAWHKLTLVSV